MILITDDFPNYAKKTSSYIVNVTLHEWKSL